MIYADAFVSLMKKIWISVAKGTKFVCPILNKLLHTQTHTHSHNYILQINTIKVHLKEL